MSISFEQLRTLGNKVVSELHKDKEPFNELVEVKKLINQVTSGGDNFVDNKASFLFYDDFLGGISKAILQSYHIKNKELIALIEELMLDMVQLFAKEIDNDNEDFARRMRTVLDPDMAFYRDYGNVRVESTTLQTRIKEDENWRKDLKKGDKIDIVKQLIDHTMLLGWTTGRIEDRNNDSITVSYDGETENFDKLLPISTSDISPFGSFTGGNEWREQLKKLDIVDCMDSNSCWYKSTILDIQTFTEGKYNRSVPKIFVCYRVYEGENLTKDSEGRSYNGLGQNFDEWLPLYSLRVQKKDTLSKKGIIKPKRLVMGYYEKPELDDTEDILLNSPQNENIYAIFRPDKAKSKTLVLMLSLFGKQGGFQKILKRISNKEKILSFELAYYYFDMIGIFSNWFHRKFAQLYIPQLQEAIVSYFKACPDLEIRKVQKERFDKTCNNLENLLRRTYTIDETHSIVEHFELSMYTTLLKSNYLQRRIEGLKGINDTCRSVKISTSRSISEEELIDWLTKQNILDFILGAHIHQQIVQRSAPVLSLMFEKKLLKIQDLDKIWDLTKDEQLRPDILKVIAEINLPIQSAELDYLGNKVISMAPTDICEEALDVIYEPTRCPVKTTEQLLKYANLMASIAFQKTYSLNVSEKALGKYADMVSTLEFEPYKLKILQQCVNQMLEKNENSILALKLIRKIVNQYLQTPVAGIAYTKSVVIEILLKDANLLPKFFDNFESYYKQVKDMKEPLLVDRYNHEENITERMNFLSFLVSNAPNLGKLPIEYFYKLWTILFEFPVSPNDSQTLFKFLKEIAPDKQTYLTNFGQSDGKKFFEEKICSATTNFANITLETFACILQFFLLVNEQEGFISVAYIPVQKQTYYTSYSNITGATYTPYSFTKKDENPIPNIKIKVAPGKLNGMEIFWKIVQEATNKDVIEKSRDFLSKAYTQFSEEIEGENLEIRGNFIETYLTKLGDVVNTKSKNRSDVICRMVKLMRDMIDESERSGTGGLKSHCALLKGDLIEMVIRNNLTTGKTIPKKMEVEAYSNTTIWELKTEIGKYLESSPDCMKLSIGNKDVKETDHGKTIGEFIQKRRGIVTIEKKNMDDVKKVTLAGSDSQLTPAAVKVFGEMFNKFAKNGKMDGEGAAAFIMATTGEKHVTPDDGRITLLFDTKFKDKDGLLLAEGFAEFYRKNIVDGREDTVWENIHVHGFRNDLKRLDEVSEKKINPSTLPRYILSCNPKAFDLLFSIMDNSDSSDELTWELISRLSTNELIYNSLLTFESVQDNQGKIMWEKLIDKKSTLRLLYCLQILESFLEEDSSKASAETMAKKKKWRQKFIEKGGFAYLLDIMMNSKPENGICFNVGKKMGRVEKECLGILGKILFSFIRIAAYSLNPNLLAEMTKAQAVYKKHLTVSNQEEEQDEEKEKEENAAKEFNNTFVTPKKKTEEEPKQKVKETVVDIFELFKAKPSTILFPISQETTNKIEKVEESWIKLETELDKEQAENVMTLIKTTDILLRQFEILAIILNNDGIEFTDTKVIKSALHLLSICISANPSTFPQVITITKKDIRLDQIIFVGLLCPQFPAIREVFMDAFFFLSFALKDKPIDHNPLHYLLPILLEKMPKRHSIDVKECGEYFQLTCKLIDLYYDYPLAKQEKILNFQDLLENMVKMLRKHHTSEKRNTTAEDKLLIGIINTIRKLIYHETSLKEKISINEGLLKEIFFSCLFPSNSIAEGLPSALVRSESQEGVLIDAQKCKTKESRTAAYKLLAAMCHSSLPCQSYLLRNCLEPLCSTIQPHNGWSYIPSSESRSRNGYAGLKNLGCICYMIAMIQQFYMVPAFRYGLMSADDKKPPKCAKPEDLDDNVLHQLQRIFAHLELTERQDYNPSKFCFAFKDQDGKPTNTAIQQDAQEFLNVVFDRIEFMLKQTPQKYLLQSVFGGKTCSQMICKGGCGTMRKSYEDFYNLSLGVKGNKNLTEALNKYITGDTISDFFCDKCQKKVDVVKRTCLHELPNVLIVHFQRIIFNFDTMMNEKINSKLEFPTEFDMEPFTVEGLEKREKKATSEVPENNSPAQDQWNGNGEDYYKYKLVGVVVHFGSADAGHYYSFINTNRKKASTDDKDIWLEYNDSHVRSFDIKNLDKECFGGVNDSSKETGWFIKGFESMKSAYMLVYERKQKTSIKKVLTKDEVENLQASQKAAILECEDTAPTRVAPGQICHVAKNNEHLTYIDYYDFTSKLSMSYYEEVFESNSQFLFERQIYSEEFFKFVHEILKESYSLLPSLATEERGLSEASMCRIASKIIFEVLAHAYSNSLLKPLSEELIQLCAKSELAANEFLSYILQNNMSQLRNILHKCTDKQVRIIVSNIITEVVLNLLPKEGNKFMEFEVIQIGEQQSYKFKSNIGALLYNLYNGIDIELARNWMRFEQYFEILLNITKKGGENMALFMSDKKLLAILVDFYLGEHSPLYQQGERRAKMGNNYKKPKFNHLIELVSYLAICADLTFSQPHFKQLQVQFKLPRSIYELCTEEKKCILSATFISHTISEGHSTQSFADLMGLFCYESEHFSKQLAKIMLESINEDPNQKMIPYFTVLRSILILSDSLQKKRLEWLFGIGTVQQGFTANLKPAEDMKFGLSLIDNIRENVFDYTSVILYDCSYKSLLNLLWRHRKSFEIFPVHCLLDLMVKSPVIFDYVNKLPPPSYQYAKYPDWIKPTVAHFPTGVRSFYGVVFSTRKEKENEALQEAQKFQEEYEKQWAKVQEKNQAYTNNPNVLLAFPQPYLIGKTISVNEIRKETKENITIVVSEIITDVYNSLPTGKENLTVPNSYFDKLREEGLNYSGSNNFEEKKNEEVAKEEKKKEELIPLRTEATILKLVAENTGTVPLKLKLTISNETPEKPANFYIPSSKIVCILNENKKETIYLVPKLTLGSDWGNFKVDWITKPVANKGKHNDGKEEFEYQGHQGILVYQENDELDPYAYQDAEEYREFMSFAPASRKDDSNKKNY